MRILVCTLLLSLCATAALAVIPAGLSEALRPVDGVVIKLSEGECLLDLGTGSGVREGDLIAVLAAGEAVTHPVTGAVVGQIDRAKALLRVVRTKPDFCWAKILTPAAAIRPADPVRRFGEVPAVFIDLRGDGHPFFGELQQALPHLAWRPGGETTLAGPGLRFTLDGQSLSVRDDRDTLLGSWPVAAVRGTEVRSTPPAAAAAALTPLGVKFKGKATGLVVADCDGDGRTEVAVALADRIEIGRIDTRTWVALTRLEVPGAVKILTLDSADLDGNGRPELLVTAVRDSRLASQVWGFDGSGYRLLAKDIPWYWRTLELPGEGLVALAQESDAFARQGYTGKPFRVTWQNGAPQAGSPQPGYAAATLHGSQPFVDAQRTLWAWLDAEDHLTVQDATGEKLWKGTEYFGGGEAFIEWEARRAKDEVQRLFIRSRLALDGGLLLVPQNQGSRTMSNQRHADRSRLVALRWNGLEFAEAWGTPLHDGYLADFAAVDVDGDGRREYLLATALPGELFGGERSTIYLWDGR